MDGFESRIGKRILDAIMNGGVSLSRRFDSKGLASCALVFDKLVVSLSPEDYEGCQEWFLTGASAAPAAKPPEQKVGRAFLGTGTLLLWQNDFSATCQLCHLYEPRPEFQFKTQMSAWSGGPFRAAHRKCLEWYLGAEVILTPPNP